MRLLSELERALTASQQALLSRDLAGLERLAGAQSRLFQGLAHCDWHSRLTDADVSAAARILQLGRVQLALLERAERSLRVLCNCVAGRQVCYEPVPEGVRIAVRKAGAALASEEA